MTLGPGRFTGNENHQPRGLAGDPKQPAPPAERNQGRNSRWQHLHCRDVLSVPDKWEFPWFAAWDHAFHLVALAEIDPELAKQQAILFLREWYMHPNGQLPAYEFAFDDVNPPVHAWACWRIYKMTGLGQERDRLFLERALQKLLLNFTQLRRPYVCVKSQPVAYYPLGTAAELVC